MNTPPTNVTNITAPPAAPPDTSALEHPTAFSPFATPVSVVGLLCTVGAFAALFAGKCVWADMQTFVPIIVGIMGGTTAVTESARRIALGRVLSK